VECHEVIFHILKGTKHHATVIRRLLVIDGFGLSGLGTVQAGIEYRQHR
jgi:hypothetical protein